jgi:hypothetical protein
MPTARSDAEPGLAHQFNLAECKRWFEQRRAGRRTLDEMRTLLTKVKAEKLRLEIDLHTGKCFARSVVEQELDRICQSVQRRMEALPSRAAPLVLGITDEATIRELLDREVRSVLAPLAELGNQIPNYRRPPAAPQS